MALGLRHLPLGLLALALASVPGSAQGEDSAAPPRRTHAARRTATVPKKGAKRRAASASRAWHTAPPGKTAPLDETGRPMLTLQALNMPEHVTLTASSDQGGFSAEDLDRAARVLRDPRTGNEHPIDPRLLDVVYRVAVHFAAPEVRIISGYRTPRSGRHSNHARGRAIDLVVPGATDEAVARFAREQGFVGVGVYPTSGFLHLDVRDRSYFWVDYSGPGKRSRTRGILTSLAAQSDAQALARGEHAIAPFVLSTDVDAALAQLGRGPAASASTTDNPWADDEDIDEGAGEPE